MTYILGQERSQLLLLPEAVDDYVGPDNPVRFIDAFVDGLDLVAASFTRVEVKVTGRPGYAPANLVQAEMLKPLLPRAFPFQHAFSKTVSGAWRIRGSRGGDVPIERRRRDAEPLRDLSYSDVGIGEHRLGGLDEAVD